MEPISEPRAQIVIHSAARAAVALALRRGKFVTACLFMSVRLGKAVGTTGIISFIIKHMRQKKKMQCTLKIQALDFSSAVTMGLPTRWTSSMRVHEFTVVPAAPRV